MGLLPHFYRSRAPMYLNAVLFVDLIVFPILLIVVFRLDNDAAKRAAPLLAVTFCATAVIVLVYLSGPITAVASGVSQLTAAPVSPTKVPWDHPGRLRLRGLSR